MKTSSRASQCRRTVEAVAAVFGAREGGLQALTPFLFGLGVRADRLLALIADQVVRCQCLGGIPGGNAYWLYVRECERSR